MLIGGKKFACEACVGSFHASDCQHSERPLRLIGGLKTSNNLTKPEPGGLPKPTLHFRSLACLMKNPLEKGASKDESVPASGDSRHSCPATSPDISNSDPTPLPIPNAMNWDKVELTQLHRYQEQKTPFDFSNSEMVFKGFLQQQQELLRNQNNPTFDDQKNSKRVRKLPATFQSSLCPKRFKRAYSLRSHIRTHMDDPLMCGTCGMSFPDRKRHESLHRQPIRNDDEIPSEDNSWFGSVRPSEDHGSPVAITSEPDRSGVNRFTSTLTQKKLSQTTSDYPVYYPITATSNLAIAENLNTRTSATHVATQAEIPHQYDTYGSPFPRESSIPPVDTEPGEGYGFKAKHPWCTAKTHIPISSTISKDNTPGDDARNASLLAEFVRKTQRSPLSGFKKIC